MLRLIQNYFGGIGRVHTQTSDNTCRFTVYRLDDCRVIKDHFNQYPLYTYKLVHFEIWSEILDLMLDKEHLTLSGLNKIVGLKANFKKSLSPMLLEAFPNHVIYDKPKYTPDLTT